MRLADGRVLLAGGYDEDGAPNTATEIYDPATNAWTLTDPLHTGRGEFALTRLDDGRVLATGGAEAGRTAEAFDPDSETWFELEHMTEPRLNQSSTVLDDGRVLVAGGFSEDFFDYTNSAEIFDPTG